MATAWGEVLTSPAHEAAPRLLGARLRIRDVTVRLTEVEAYEGHRDPGSHAFRGQTARNGSMFLPAGHIYVYRSYGIHLCLNLVCDPAGEASGLLIRAGEVMDGLAQARQRRGENWAHRELARGPGRMGQALGLRPDDDGAQLGTPDYQLTFAAQQPDVSCGPRVGVSGEGGSDRFPWRFWITGDETVSRYRRS